jgi:hypothetical protein
MAASMLVALRGCGFFVSFLQPCDAHQLVADVEAVLGVLIEVSFIATFTQRFLGK